MSQAASSDSRSEVTPGQIVGGKWRIVRIIGRGGMGAVYEAQNVAIGKRAALKFIDAEFARQPDLASRFRREAEAASVVESAHIVQVFDSGTADDGVPYIVMELLQGEDLRTRLRRVGKLPAAEAVHIVIQALRGLRRAHEAGIVHRDLKPENIFLLDRDDDPLFAKILDFGISKFKRRGSNVGTGTLTRQGVVLGTPFYMSPEQAQAFADVDERTDLWAAGAILFECVLGRPPFSGETYESIIVSICTTDAPGLRSQDPNASPSLDAVVRKALTRERSQRFQSAKEMIEALRQTGICVTPYPALNVAEFPSEPGSAQAEAAATQAEAAVMTPLLGGSMTPLPGPSAPVTPGTAMTPVPATADAPAPAGGASRPLSAAPARSRRRGLVVAATTMACGFVLTLAVLVRRDPRHNPASATPVASASALHGPSVQVVPVPRHAEIRAAEKGAPPVEFVAADAGPDVRPIPGTAAEPMSPAAAASSTSQSLPSGSAALPSPPRRASDRSPRRTVQPEESSAEPSNPLPRRDTPGAGVADGLQIKTTYP